MELLSPCWSSSRERRQYNAVILSDCFIICSSIFIGQSANARLLWVIDSHTLFLVCQLHCFFRECVFPIKAAGKVINSMPLFKAYCDLRQLLPHGNGSVTSTVLIDADIAFLFFHFHLPFSLVKLRVWDIPMIKNLRVWQHRMCLLFSKPYGMPARGFLQVYIHLLCLLFC